MKRCVKVGKDLVEGKGLLFRKIYQIKELTKLHLETSSF